MLRKAVDEKQSNESAVETSRSCPWRRSEAGSPPPSPGTPPPPDALTRSTCAGREPGAGSAPGGQRQKGARRPRASAPSLPPPSIPPSPPPTRPLSTPPSPRRPRGLVCQRFQAGEQELIRVSERRSPTFPGWLAASRLRRGFASFSRPLRFLSSSGSYSFPARKQPSLATAGGARGGRGGG